VPLMTALKPPDMTQPLPEPEPFNVHAMVDVLLAISWLDSDHDKVTERPSFVPVVILPLEAIMNHSFTMPGLST